MQSLVILEGLLDMQRIDYFTPIDCRAEHPCQIGYTFKKHLGGWAVRKNGATSWENVEQTMERLSGRYVKLTVEFEPPFSEESATTGQQQPQAKTAEVDCGK